MQTTAKVPHRAAAPTTPLPLDRPAEATSSPSGPSPRLVLSARSALTPEEIPDAAAPRVLRTLGAQYPLIRPDQQVAAVQPFAPPPQPSAARGVPAGFAPAGFASSGIATSGFAPLGFASPSFASPGPVLPRAVPPSFVPPTRPVRRGGLRWTMSLLIFLLLAAAAVTILIGLTAMVRVMTGLGTPLSPLDATLTASVVALGLIVAAGVGFLPGFVGFTLGTGSAGWGALNGLWTSPALMVIGLLAARIVLG